MFLLPISGCPGENGTALIGKVDIRGKKPKVIVCSAFITAELEEKLRQNDACMLRKPIKLDELNEAVQISLKKDQREERRQQVIGDMLWPCPPSTDRNLDDPKKP